MQAIEFQTTLHNGVVTIPPEYSAQWEGKTIRVIVLDEAAPTPATEANPLKGSVTFEGDLLAPIDEAIAPDSLLSRLKQIKITAPHDFSETFHLS
ncbi:MAG: hypothetical protein DCF22_17795 [Leptolyngbya sp.]|nr:MAG: hypothetical protein DCF22_17795 [Leptolyngbya sp.]